MNWNEYIAIQNNTVLGKDYIELFIGNLFTHGGKCFINSCLFHEKWISIADMDDSISLENELKLTEDILDQLLQSFKRLTWNFIIFL